MFKVINDDCNKALDNIKNIDLVFTSPPYFNAKLYSQYESYDEYLEFINQVFTKCFNVLNEGRFFVVNISCVIVPRKKRNDSSKRLAIPFHFNHILESIGFEFIDDIIWLKPEGAASNNRGRRFSVDRNPLQYKTLQITEYVLVYRKPGKIIDYYIRKNKYKNESKIDSYQRTNVWKINPSKSKYHPATFPLELAENIVKYYSFKNDIILDPFGGIGTTLVACKKLERNCIIIEKDKKYSDFAKELAKTA